MITTIASAPTQLFGMSGLAPASPQSARGESVNADGPRQDVVAASQANAPLYDQRAQLTDMHVAARAQAGEQAARMQPRSGTAARTNDSDQHRPSPSHDSTPGTAADATRPAELSRVQPVGEAEAEAETADHGRTRQQAQRAYAAIQQAPAPSGEMLSMSL